MTKSHPFSNPSGNTYTREELSPYFLQAVQTVKAELPGAIGQRLTHGRHARNHGSYNDFTLINMWDKHQTDVIPRDHFTYCLNYWQNRRDGNPEDGELHLWLNRVRVYQNRDSIIELLEKRLPQALPDGFTFTAQDRAFSISHRFWFPADLELLLGYVVPLFKQLTLGIHPILMEVIDDYTGVLDREAIKRVIRERDRIAFAHPGKRSAEELRAYNRSIPKSLRRKILNIHGHRCALCDSDLDLSGHHIDHILPFSRGGLTTEDNLQALCPSCNLTKGNR